VAGRRRVAGSGFGQGDWTIEAAQGGLGLLTGETEAASRHCLFIMFVKLNSVRIIEIETRQQEFDSIYFPQSDTNSISSLRCP